MAVMITRAAVAIVGLLAAWLPEDPPKPAFAPTADYEVRQLEGWTLRVNRAFLRDEPKLAGDVLQLLGDQLRGIERMVPAPAVERLRQVTIWVEEKEPHHPCMCYHPAPGWLEEHGMNPAKARGVEIANARNFLSWCHEQPWMVFHELAHAYHDQVVAAGFGNEAVARAYEAARASGRYGKVLHYNGREERHYALTNPMEYFAEGSEARFGTNDFYPFVRAELKAHDPALYELLDRLWSEPGSGGP